MVFTNYPIFVGHIWRFHQHAKVVRIHTVDGWNPANQIGSLSHYLQGFINSRIHNQI